MRLGEMMPRDVEVIGSNASLKEAVAKIKDLDVGAHSRLSGDELKGTLTDRDITDILKLAEEKACQTIVVGRSSFPWYKETFHRHLADKLVRKAIRVTIWVVEQP